MAMKPWADICYSDGKYTDKNTGKEKNRYEKLGTIFKDTENNSLSIRIPVLDKWCKVFPKDRQQQQSQDQSFQGNAPMGNNPPPQTDENLPF